MKLFIASLVIAIIVGMSYWIKNNPVSTFNSTPSSTPSSTVLPSQGISAKFDSFTVLITPDGFSPRSLLIHPGDRVTFINGDTLKHWPVSDPHPTHEFCPGFDAGHGLKGGERYTATFTVAKTCNFHDHLNSEEETFKGTIRVK